MGEGKSVSVLWFLGLILATLLWMVHCLSAIALALHAQNMYLVQWREQFSRTFQYVEDDDYEASGDDLYGSGAQGGRN